MRRRHGRFADRLRTDRRDMLRTGAVLAGTTLLARATAAGAAPLARQSAEGTPTMKYHVEGRLLEVCTCGILCPCWVGEDPDGGTCDSSLAWQIDTGTIEGVDVSGRTLALSVH